MSKRPVGALAGIAMIILLAAPARASGSSPQPLQGGLSGTPPELLQRDAVIERPAAAAARISASASTGRYPINDGSGATIAVSVTTACQAYCTAADPQRIANFIGTLVHGFEVQLATVQLDTPSQLGIDCGASACYYGSQNKIVVSGNDTPAPDGASREFVLAHEYGHHVARHREGPPPFPPPIDWGTARWASHENVCRLQRAGTIFAGTLGLRYFRDPGEAFAEAFARNRFPDAAVPWRWHRSLRPDAAAFKAIRQDTLAPWYRRTSLVLSGRAPTRKGGAAFRLLRTPLDGTVSFRPGGSRLLYELSLKGPDGRVLRTSRPAFGARPQVNFTVCGQARLGVVIKATRQSDRGYQLRIQRP